MKIRIKAILMGIVLLFSGCALENEVYDRINPSIFPQTESDLEALVTGNVYSIFTSNGYNNLFNVANGIMTANEVVSDIMTCMWGNWDTFEFNSYESTHPLVANNFNHWKYYNRLGGMLLTLDRIEKSNVKISDEKKAILMAETKCGIGFMAWLFYDLYGPIVLPDLEALLHPEQDRIIPRATHDEMYQFIENYLTEAAEVLPYKYENEGDKGRFTKGLANTLLLKFYMHEAEWDKAVAIGRDMVETNADKYGYKIADNYYDLFDPTGSSNAEVIFYTGHSTAADFNMLYQVHVYPADFPGTTGLWGGYRMAWQFYHSYDKRDARLERIYAEYTTADGIVRNEENDRRSSSEPLYWGAVPGKYSLDGIVGGNGNCDLIVYRFSDVITLYAEALVRANNTVEAKAKEYLNEIRTKHGKLPAFTDAELATPDLFLDKMLEERGHEFYMEGIRRQDLIRHGRFIEKALEKAREYNFSTEKIETMVDGQYKYYLLPIPQSVLTAGKGQIKQNPGYE